MCKNNWQLLLLVIMVKLIQGKRPLCAEIFLKKKNNEKVMWTEWNILPKAYNTKDCRECILSFKMLPFYKPHILLILW